VAALIEEHQSVFASFRVQQPDNFSDDRRPIEDVLKKRLLPEFARSLQRLTGLRSERGQPEFVGKHKRRFGRRARFGKLSP